MILLQFRGTVPYELNLDVSLFSVPGPEAKHSRGSASQVVVDFVSHLSYSSSTSPSFSRHDSLRLSSPPEREIYEESS